MTSFTLILCVLRMCETHCLCESDYIGVYTLLLFMSIIGLYIELRSTGMKDLKTGA